MKKKVDFVIVIEIAFIIILIICQYSIWRVVEGENKKVILANTINKNREIVVLDRLENSTFLKEIDEELLKIIIEKNKISKEELKDIYMRNSLSRHKYLKALNNLLDLEVLEIKEKGIVKFRGTRKNNLDGNENKIIQLVQENKDITLDSLEELFLNDSVSNANFNISFKRLLENKVIKLNKNDVERNKKYSEEKIFILASGIIYLLLIMKIIENYKINKKIEKLETKLDYMIEVNKKEKEVEKISLKLEELKITTSDIVIILAEKIEELKRKIENR